MTFNYRLWQDEAKKEDIHTTSAQDRLIAGAETGHASQIGQVRMTGDLYILNRQQRMVDQLIASNERLGASTERHAAAMARATWVLAVATIVLAIATVVLIFVTAAT